LKQTNTIKTALQKRERIEAEVASSQKRLAERTAQIPALAAVVDLDNTSAMAELGRIHLEVSILPSRISVNEDALLKANAELMAACDDFIVQDLSPKVREQEVRARAKTRAALKDIFPAGNELDRAIDASTLVREAGGNQMSLQGDPIDGPASYAGRILNAWQAAQQLEAKLK
jgi:hypothetical protein